MKYILLAGFLFANSIQTAQRNLYRTFAGSGARVSNSIVGSCAYPVSRLGNYAARTRAWFQTKQSNVREVWKHLRVSERLSDASRQAVKVAQQHPYATAATVVALCRMAGVVFKNQFDTWQHAQEIKTWAISKIDVLMSRAACLEDRLNAAQELLREIDQWSYYDAKRKVLWENYLKSQIKSLNTRIVQQQADALKLRTKEEREFLARVAAQAALADSLSHGVSPSPSASPSCFSSAANSVSASSQGSQNEEFQLNIDTTTKAGQSFSEAFRVAWDSSKIQAERIAAVSIMTIWADLLDEVSHDQLKGALSALRERFIGDGIQLDGDLRWVNSFINML